MANIGVPVDPLKKRLRHAMESLLYISKNISEYVKELLHQGE